MSMPNSIWQFLSKVMQSWVEHEDAQELAIQLKDRLMFVSSFCFCAFFGCEGLLRDKTMTFDQLASLPWLWDGPWDVALREACEVMLQHQAGPQPRAEAEGHEPRRSDYVRLLARNKGMQGLCLRTQPCEVRKILSVGSHGSTSNSLMLIAARGKFRLPMFIQRYPKHFETIGRNQLKADDCTCNLHAAGGVSAQARAPPAEPEPSTETTLQARC